MRIGDDGYVRMVEELMVGDEVRIKHGPLSSFTGVFDYNINDSSRVAILLDTVSYQGRIVIERDLLEKKKTVARA